MAADFEITPDERLTITTYDQHAAKWAAEHSTPGFWADEMSRFQQFLPKGRVLEVGCGGGRDAKELRARGYGYIGVDISNGLVEEARINVPGATFLHRSVYDLGYENMFDGVWCSATLLHIPKTRIGLALQNIHGALRNEGVGFISVKQGSGEDITRETLDEGTPIERFFAFYEQPEFKSVLEDNCFDILDSSVKPMSAKTIWLIYFIRALKQNAEN